MDHLYQYKYTSPGRVVLHARSAGGVIAGAMLNSKPEVSSTVLLNEGQLSVHGS